MLWCYADCAMLRDAYDVRRDLDVWLKCAAECVLGDVDWFGRAFDAMREVDCARDDNDM